MRRLIVIFFSISILFASCDVLNQVLNQYATSLQPSEQEIVQALKRALQYGVDFAVSQLAKKDGYYKNQAVRILLPDQVQSVLNYALNNQTVKRLGLDKVLKSKIDKVVISMNRAAEEAAKEAKPIFINAITKMTITVY